MNGQYEEVKPKSNYIKFNKLNDYIQGTLVKVFRPTTPDSYGRMDPKYHILADEGSVHLGKNDEAGNYAVDPTPTVLVQGEEYIVTGGKPSIDMAMKEISVGTKVCVQLSEFRASKKPGMKPAKIMKIMKGPVDQAWIDSQSATNVDM